jgi:hypothetical protein
MSQTEFTTPVIDSVPKVNREVAVGEDLEFQRRWWRFEMIVWTLFVLVLLCALLGLFGRGWLARTQRSSPDGSLTIQYDRIQRTGSPSDLTLTIGPRAMHNGQIRLFLSRSTITRLGAQRISPQPEKSTLGDGGIIYTFPVQVLPASVVVSLEPSEPGRFAFRAALPELNTSLESRVIVVP